MDAYLPWCCSLSTLAIPSRPRKNTSLQWWEIYRKSRKNWARIQRILGIEGANGWVSGTLFKSVVLEVLLSGSKTWVMTPRMGQALGGFQHRVACWLTSKQPWKLQDRSWEYPSLEEYMLAAGLEKVEEHVFKKQSTVAHYIQMRSILDLCEEQVQRLGTQVSKVMGIVRVRPGGSAGNTIGS